ncbi:hypothetical protein C7999DRAFT_18375 [Corynascus novoguineensis]|uniref:Uncharacterized protein n=1 Tax=Corynascus novoguineensis TaxID=1126955 RepID=A0AAN7HB27_9PEZI|nr:hypothetical protein C7999DRAFT_18375 [Corynascus novoguineensis]
MGYAKDQIIECMEEERNNLEQTLDEIESYGEGFECPNEHCDSRVCSKLCFARSCFDWCLTHSHPSVEYLDGKISVEVNFVIRNVEGQLISETRIEQRRVCGDEEARSFPDSCKIVTSPFITDYDEDTGAVLTVEGQLWQFEEERRLGKVMARESP